MWLPGGYNNNIHETDDSTSYKYRFKVFKEISIHGIQSLLIFEHTEVINSHFLS